MPLVLLDESVKIVDPAQWTKRFDCAAAALAYIEKFGEEESEKYRKYLTKKNIRYGPGDRQLLDIYCKGNPSEAPILLFLHGGYWQGFSKDISAFWINPYIERGYCIIMIGYDLCPAVTLSDLILETKAALKYCFQYAREMNSKSISLIGHSAGAHLGIAALDEEILQQPNIDSLKSLFLVAGIYDLNVLLNTPVNEDNALSMDESNVQQLSPMFFDYSHLKKYAIKYYLCTAEYESPMFIEQSEKMSKHLTEFQLNVEYKFMENLDHFNLMENFGREDYELTNALLESLKC